MHPWLKHPPYTRNFTVLGEHDGSWGFRSLWGCDLSTLKVTPCCLETWRSGYLWRSRILGEKNLRLCRSENLRPRMAILEVDLACLEKYRVSDLSMKTPPDESATGSCISALSGAEVICGMILRRWVDWRVRTPSIWIRGRSYAGSLREVIVVFLYYPRHSRRMTKEDTDISW